MFIVVEVIVVEERYIEGCFGFLGILVLVLVGGGGCRWFVVVVRECYVGGLFEFFLFVVGGWCRFVLVVAEEWGSACWFLVGWRRYRYSENGKQTVIFKMKREKIKIMIGRRVTVDVVFKFFLSSSIFFSSSTHINPIV
jgi:hypothetical protein